jgi:hypothetical protein
MTILSSNSSNYSAQAQVIGNGQQPQEQIPSSITTLPQAGTMPSIEITSHSSGQQVNAGPLTISGTSSDTSSTNCEVYADWNDSMPFEKTIAAGPGGPDDYSKWTFTYNSDYHLIQNGTNNLTSKISCVDGPTNLTKWNSVNLIGVNSSNSGAIINQAITSAPITSAPPSSTVGPPLPTPSQTEVTSPALDPVVGEVNEDEGNAGNEEEEEGNENDDSNSDDTSDEEEEEDEENNGSDDEDSDNGDGEENGDGGDDGGDNGDSDGDGSDNGPVDFGSDGPVDFGSDGPVD